MVDAKGFYTIKGYQIQEGAELTPAMEDYLEMICRLMETHTVVRLGELAEVLHVKPSSASKMIRLLSETGYINAEKIWLHFAHRKRTSGRRLFALPT